MIKKINRFEGRHYETGSVQNILALQGVKAPHTGRPYSEAFLLGVSGGIAFGYFTFEYKGFLPHLALLPRNTFGSGATCVSNCQCGDRGKESDRGFGSRQPGVGLGRSVQPAVYPSESQRILEYDPDPCIWHGGRSGINCRSFKSAVACSHGDSDEGARPCEEG